MKKIIALLSTTKILLLFSFLIIAAYFFPYIYLGQNFPVGVLDNMDSNIIWVKLTVENGHVFSLKNETVPQMMEGIAATSLWPNYDLTILIFYLFGMYPGYVISKILMALVGFVGMYFLLNKHFVKNEKYNYIVIGTALCFALLPFWSFTQSVSGMPLLLYAFLNIRAGNKKFYNWLIIIFIGFYSSLVFSGFFFLVIMCCLLVYDFFSTRKINWASFKAICLLTLAYIISHFPLFSAFLINTGYKSHRFEFEKEAFPFSKCFSDFKGLFMHGQYHAHSLHIIILCVVLISIPFVIKNRETTKKFWVILTFIFLTSLLYGFMRWGPLNPFFDFLNSVLPIQLQRFHTLHAMFWCILFAIALLSIAQKIKIGNYIVVVLILFQLKYIIRYHEYFQNKNKSTYKSFYSEKLFNDIKQYIGSDQSSYKVISLGMHPAVSQYNGFYTLDAYLPDYPLNYKHKFRKIMVKELDKNETMKKYFDNWGSRCYAFSSELGKNFMYPKSTNKKVKVLNFDNDVLKSMNCRYIFSAVEIDASNTGYNLLKTFEDKDSYWKIYLYQIV